ncbi:hypothetical protein EXU85_22005 [Spirosoma sp. KCTC 42546]|uniref:hypothetical protein n=1 Tax=Spirosoma sp. KCTC 42546 TaxID=2520506 RepID=UPI00115BE38C|nr:hypothetical protein [Spirosoma sp. KCTC 42546]QDK81143.1 hypothetical protein EXU85_22005 [Spirosoma sp. KCTC 42546]
MNKTATNTFINYVNKMVSRTDWQREVESLYTNYYLISLVLAYPSTASAPEVSQFRRLQSTLIKTIEQFVAELDQQTKQTQSPSAINCLLKSHIAVMQTLNGQIGNLLKEQAAGVS